MDNIVLKICLQIHKLDLHFSPKYIAPHDDDDDVKI